MAPQDQDNTTHSNAMKLYPLALAISDREQTRSEQQADIESAYLKTGRYFAFPGHDADRKPPLKNMADLAALPHKELTGGGRIFATLYTLFYLRQPILLLNKDTDRLRAVLSPACFLEDVVNFVREEFLHYEQLTQDVLDATGVGRKHIAEKTPAQTYFNHPVLFHHSSLKAPEGSISQIISQTTLNTLNRSDSNVFLNPMACQSALAALAWFNTDTPTKNDLPESTRCALAALFQVALSIRFDDTSHIADNSGEAPTARHMNTRVYAALEGEHGLLSTDPLYAALRNQVKTALVKLCALAETHEAVFDCLIYVLTWIYTDTRSMTIAHKLGIMAPASFERISHVLRIQSFIRNNAELFADEGTDARAGKLLSHVTLKEVGATLGEGALSEHQNEQAQLFAATVISCLREILNQTRYIVR